MRELRLLQYDRTNSPLFQSHRTFSAHLTVGLSPLRMSIVGFIGQSLSQSEAVVALIGSTVVICVTVWRLLGWIIASPTSPDPWNEEVAADLVRDDCPQICHQCLTPHDPSSHFCSHCGTMVGTFTCLIPPLYLYSIGDVFRAGAEGTYRRSSWLIVSCFLAAFVYLFWIPFPLGCLAVIVYWRKLFKNLPATRSLVADEDRLPADSQ